MPITLGGLKRKILTKYVHFTIIKKVKNKSFCILCNNCWAGHIYQQLKIPYNTPTVGLFFYAPCYLKFLEDLEYYLQTPLKFKNKSQYEKSEHLNSKGWYPIGSLGDIEIHFLHYHSENEAFQKWEKRKKRINMENLFVVGSEIDLCTPSHIRRFQNLPYKNKIFFTANSYTDDNHLIHIKEYADKGVIGDIYTENLIVHKYLNIPKWLNINR